jgi:hypothetical protein
LIHIFSRNFFGYTNSCSLIRKIDSTIQCK